MRDFIVGDDYTRIEEDGDKIYIVLYQHGYIIECIIPYASVYTNIKNKPFEYELFVDPKKVNKYRGQTMFQFTFHIEDLDALSPKLQIAILMNLDRIK